MLVIAIVYRLNTFPFIHINIFHAILNVLALTPLLERFEHEHGTLTSVALFFGREYKAPLMRQDGTGIHSGDTWTNLIGNSSDHATGVALHTGRNYFGLEHGSHGSQVCFVPEHSWDCSICLFTTVHSLWVFLLLGVEAIRTYRSNPYLTIATHNIPTWTTPLILTLCVAALLPSTSLLGHLCGLAIGYTCEFRRPFRFHF